MKLTRRTFLGAAAATALPAQQRRGLKIFMNCDMDGSPGIFTREQAWYWENGVRPHIALEARELFTADINAISAAALGAGVTEDDGGRRQIQSTARRPAGGRSHRGSPRGRASRSGEVAARHRLGHGSLIRRPTAASRGTG